MKKTRDDRVEKRIGKWKMKRVCGGKIKSAFTLPGAHHLEGEIGSNDLCLRILRQRLPRQVARPGTDIQQTGIFLQLRVLDDLPSPANILPACHQAIHQIVAPGDPGEHGLNVRCTFRSCEVCHGFSRMIIDDIALRK
ncbi:MAG TPA: hypothetical protein VHP14_01960 [Anaerolineales bacterium]|nr:hypothetical protein [Anaerolineales bacterium]